MLKCMMGKDEQMIFRVPSNSNTPLFYKTHFSVIAFFKKAKWHYVLLISFIHLDSYWVPAIGVVVGIQK